MAVRLAVHIERWPIAGSFVISRGAKSEAVVVVAELRDGSLIGRGECVPLARYDQTVEGEAARLKDLAEAIAGGLDRTALQGALPAGPARNALDCAFWDLEAKRAGKPVHALAGLSAPRPVTTALTISLGTPDSMAAAVQKVAQRKLLKIKLGGDGDPARIAAVRRAAPRSDLIVDANEAWTENNLAENLRACAEAGVTLVEQPLPAGRDDALASITRPIAVCADESIHDRASLASLAGKYDAINIKLDKSGGLTEALALAEEAERAGLAIMVGCMVSTSLAMAPAMLVAQRASGVGLDGPLLLAKDRDGGLRYEGSEVYPANPKLWG
ncbi:MAG: L-Ala-D/L-Glu epimerase [Alphaproteobacteria bacterium]|nr:L-Ala-D/L-Glu epimerase [Alphaproteobacteria bacterium]